MIAGRSSNSRCGLAIVASVGGTLDRPRQSTAELARDLCQLPPLRLACDHDSLPGYSGSAERRTSCDQSIRPIASAIEEVMRRAGGPVHLFRHSFGGEVGLVVALRGHVSLQSLSILSRNYRGEFSHRRGHSGRDIRDNWGRRTFHDRHACNCGGKPNHKAYICEQRGMRERLALCSLKAGRMRRADQYVVSSMSRHLTERPSNILFRIAAKGRNELVSPLRARIGR